MAGLAEIADILLRVNDPSLVDFRKNQPAGEFEKYAKITGDIDTIHFVEIISRLRRFRFSQPPPLSSLLS